MRLPAFQAQNPSISGYSLGWSSCQAFVGAMNAAFDKQVSIVTRPKRLTGGALREQTGDRVGGLNLRQIDDALNDGWDIDLSTYYRLPWPIFERMIDDGMGGSLSVWYAPIADSRFDAGRGFRENHQIWVPPGFAAMDPLADGRYGQAYKYRGEPYPRALLREAAGKLNLSSTGGYRPLGPGYVYCQMTRDRVHTYRLRFDKGEAFWVYRVGPDGRIPRDRRQARQSLRFTAETSAPCTVSKSYEWPGVGRRILVRILAGTLKDRYVSIPQPSVHLEVVT